MLNRLLVNKTFTALAGLLLSFNASAARDEWQLNMYKGVTPISKDIYHLHNIAMIVCAIIGIVVFSVMIYSLIYHRKSRGAVPSAFHANTKLEIFWSIIPFLILVGLAVPATRVLMNIYDTDEPNVTVKIVGSQWKWQYQYLDQGISYFSNLATPYQQIKNQQKKNKWYLLEVDKPLVLPVNKKIRFLVTSSDVVHSWWVPQLGVKRDAIPGFIYEAWVKIERPGTYRGQCTELCGINHAYMPIVVKAVSDQQFTAWVAQQPKVPEQYSKQSQAAVPDAKQSPNLTRINLMATGKQLYEQQCAACHQSNGTGIAPMYPPLKGSSVAVGDPIDRHIEIILHGVPGSAMQAYNAQLTDAEIAAIVTYERNAWENNTGDVVQAADVAAVRQHDQQAPKIVQKTQAGGLR